MKDWQLYILVLFAAVGVTVCGYHAVKLAVMVYDIIVNLSTTLQEAVVVAKRLNSDFRTVQAIYDQQQEEAARPAQMAATGAPANEAITFPMPPFLDKFEKKPEEPDAAPERIENVDVTPDDDEVQNLDRLEQLRMVGVNTEQIEIDLKEQGRGAEV